MPRSLDLPIARSHLAYLEFVQGLKRFTFSETIEPLERSFERDGTLDGDLLYRFHQHLSRHSQQMMWAGIERACAANEEFMVAALQKPTNLRLNPALPLPSYFVNDFHCRAGGHYLDAPHQGWYTDLAHLVYFGGRENKRESKYRGAEAVPPGSYQRILDLGCGIGQSTWPLCGRFPAAEVHAVDLSAGLLRYAAKRAEAQGQAIHFSQQNAERTDFPNGHFDLVYANILFHEIPPEAAANVIHEAARLLASGGRFVIADVEPYRHVPGFRAYISDWQTEHNGEVFWRSYCQLDLPHMLAEAGFSGITEGGLNKPLPGGRRHPWVTVGLKP